MAVHNPHVATRATRTRVDYRRRPQDCHDQFCVTTLIFRASVMLETLPDEVVLHILAELAVVDRVHCRLVCTSLSTECPNASTYSYPFLA